MSLPDLSIELSEPPRRLVTEQLLKLVKLKPEMIESMEQLLDYWKIRLSDATTLELPTNRPRPAVQSFREATQQFSLPFDLVDGLNTLSRREGVTLFMTLVAAFQVLLHRYSGQDDIVIGTRTGEGSHLEFNGLNDFFVNILVLRTDLSGNPSFRDLLAQVREVTLGAYANRDLPFEKLVEVLNPQRDLSRNPLFQVMFVLQNVPDDKLQINEITSEFLQVDNGTTQLDLNLELSETSHGLAGVVKYATDLFEAATIDRLIGHFQTLLKGISAHPDARLSKLPLLTEPERQQLLVEWNDTTVTFSQDRFVHQLFEEQVVRSPEAVAVVYEDQQLTYGELNARANQLAHYLRHIGVGPEVLVGICLERSLDMVVGLLGILKAGGAYVPLDPTYPKERLEFMLEDSAPLVLLTHGRYEALFVGMRVIIDLEAASRPWESQPDTNPDHQHIQLGPENLAYVMYTSGSTGRPKGVGIMHHGLQNQLSWYIHESHLSSDDKALVVTSIAYALTQRASFGPLLAGARLILASEPFDSKEIVKLLAKERISMMILTPNGFSALIDASAHGELGGVREVFLAGEPLEPYRLIALPEPRPEFVNNYGATECTAAAIYYRVPSDLEQYRNRSLPIGRPIWNARVYILDTYYQPVPIGVAGEIHIGGVPVGRGYLNQPELTAERFVRDPFVAEADARMYKTGDLGRWLPDGTIEYLGRNDFQVKIRGLRIELGEIESALRRHPQLREVVAGMYEPIPGDKRLVAYLVPQGVAVPVPTPSELRDFLKPTLPEFMVPLVFVFLDALPITPNGKLDRKALPEPDQSQQVLNDDFIASRNPVEKLLAEIWGEVLRINRVGIYDNFFELGGHSLLATQVIVRVQEQLSMEIPLRTLFDMPTIAELANHLGTLPSAGEQVQLSAIRRYEGQELPPLSFAQMRMWLVEYISGPSGAYNLPFFLKLEGVLEDEMALERAINEIVRRHESLRTCFTEQEGVPFQMIQPSCSITLVKLDLSNAPEELRETELSRHIQAQAVAPFDLKKGPLLRAMLMRLGDTQHVLLLTFHHIIFDGWSMDVFGRELSALYEAFSRGRPSPLPELPIQYADYAAWQREELQDEAMEQLLDYWKARLADAPTLELPTDKPRSAVQSFRGATKQFNLSPDLTKGLKTLSRREGVTLFMTLVTTFQILLHHYTGQDDIAIGTPTAGRSRLELEGLIGFFVNTLVLRADLSGNPSFRELLAQVREDTLGAYANQDMPFEKLVEALNPQRNLSRNPLFQVMFALQNIPDDKLQLNEIIGECLQTEIESAKFDLTLELTETPDDLAGRLEYATDLFEATTIDRLIGHFQTLLKGIVAHPEARLSELPLLTEPELRQLLVEWNDTAAPFPRDNCIHELFEMQAAETPQAVAVVYEDSQLSYAEVNAQANRLAHHLRELGVKPDVLVAICVERCLNMVVGLLAILKAGGAYLPLDPTYPKERLVFMLEDSAPLALLTQGRLESLFEGREKALPVIDLEAKSPSWASQPHTNLRRHEIRLTPKHLAYVIYTSGSTGKPKGVTIEHRGLCNMITDLRSRYKICTEDRILQFASIAFDVSVEEIFVTLLSGAALVLRSDDWIIGASKFWALCEKKGVSIVNLPTLFWQQLVQEDQAVIPTTIRQIIIGSEAVNSKVLADWFKRESYRPKLFNAYGPTEATVNATIHEPSADSLSWQSIGRPIANTRIYILNANNQPVPIGLAGELYIGGAGIARGYLNRPELTEERFVVDPYSAEVGARMYKTGDLARWLADGTIEFLGRNDFQVKIRGGRIELGEIEAKLAEHPEVRDVAVLAHEDSDGFKRLVAYLVLEDGFNPSVPELRDFLKKNMPEFMVPSIFMFFDALPITPNGKLDRKALPEPDYSRQDMDAGFIVPRSPVEQLLTEIWGEVLNINHVGIHDDFFELGGHSLLAIQVIVRVREQLSVEIPLITLFEMSTPEKLAKLIENNVAKASNSSKAITAQLRSAYKINNS